MTTISQEITLRREMLARYDLVELQNHPANVDQDHLTFCGFFTREGEFKALATALQKNIAEYDN